MHKKKTVKLFLRRTDASWTIKWNKLCENTCVPWYRLGCGDHRDKLGTVGYLLLNFGTRGNVGPHLYQRHLSTEPILLPACLKWWDQLHVSQKMDNETSSVIHVERCKDQWQDFFNMEELCWTFLLQPLQGALKEANCFSTLEERSTFLGSKGTRQRGQRGEATWRHGCRHSPQNLKDKVKRHQLMDVTQSYCAALWIHSCWHRMILLMISEKCALLDLFLCYFPLI